MESAESFVTLTNMDEENIFLSLFAKTISNAKLVAKVNRLAYDDIIDSLDIGSVISRNTLLQIIFCGVARIEITSPFRITLVPPGMVV